MNATSLNHDSTPQRPYERPSTDWATKQANNARDHWERTPQGHREQTRGHMQAAGAYHAAPTRPTGRPPSKAPMVGIDPAGITAGMIFSDGKHTTGWLTSWSKNWLGVHYDRTTTLASDDEYGVGFHGAAGSSYMLLGGNGAYLRNGTLQIGARAGGSVRICGSNTCTDITSPKLADKGLYQVRIERTPRHWPWLLNLGISAFAWLRTFFRCDYRQPISMVYTPIVHREMRNALLCTGMSTLRAELVDFWRGLLNRGPLSVPKLDDLPAVQAGEELSYTYDKNNAWMACLGPVFAGFGADWNNTEQLRVTVRRDGVPERLTVRLERMKHGSSSIFGILPGGPMVGRSKASPEYWARDFIFDAKTESHACKDFLSQLAGSKPPKPEELKKLMDDHISQTAEQLYMHNASFKEMTYGSQLALNGVYSGRILLPQDVGWGLVNSHRVGDYKLQAQEKSEGSQVEFSVSEVACDKVRGLQGIQRQLLSTTIMTPQLYYPEREINDPKDAKQKLILRACSKPAPSTVLVRLHVNHSRATPQELERQVLAPWRAMFGPKRVGSYGDVPHVPGGHHLTVTLTLDKERLEALADVSLDSMRFQESMPNQRTMCDLITCVTHIQSARNDNTGDADFTARAAQAVQQMFKVVGTRDVTQATLLIAALNYLLPPPKNADHDALKLEHTTTLSRVPAQLASTLSERYPQGPVAREGVGALRARFHAVRDAMARIATVERIVSSEPFENEAPPNFDAEKEALLGLVRVTNPTQRRELLALMAKVRWKNAKLDDDIVATLQSFGDVSEPTSALHRAQELLVDDAWKTFTHDAACLEALDRAYKDLQEEAAQNDEASSQEVRSALENLKAAIKEVRTKIHNAEYMRRKNYAEDQARHAGGQQMPILESEEEIVVKNAQEEEQQDQALEGDVWHDATCSFVA